MTSALPNKNWDDKVLYTTSLRMQRLLDSRFHNAVQVPTHFTCFPPAIGMALTYGLPI